MKKIPRSILLLLLLLAISSDLLAQTYKRSIGGSWNEPTMWNPNGIPNNDQITVKLDNVGTNPDLPSLNLNLNNSGYNLAELDVSGNAWHLSNGRLIFHNPPSKLAAIINYKGTATLILDTPLKLESFSTNLDVSNSAGTIKLLGEVNKGKFGAITQLNKSGPGTLLIEGPFHIPNLDLKGGILGIAPASMKDQPKLTISGDSALFALTDDIRIEKLTILKKATLKIIDNPDPNTHFHSITLGDDLTNGGTIDQLSRGNLTFNNIEHFYGTIESQPKSGPIIIYGHTRANIKIKTQPGAGPIVLNGSTGGDIEINGSTITGTGEGGDLIATNGATISPGYDNSFGTLSFTKNVKLDPSTILNFDFSNKDTNTASRDLIRVNGNLTLGGKLNINADTASRLEDGAYPLFKYGGKLKGNNLVISSVPPGYDASNFAVITEVPGQVLLGVGPPGTVRLWKGDHTKSGSSTIHGGKGTWSGAGLNFTDPTGTQSETGGGNTAVDVFGGNPGEVGVQGPVHVHEIQILTNNYTFYPLNGDSQFLANGPITIEVGGIYQVNISVPFTGGQTSAIIKDGDGILILSGDNRNVGSFVLNGGTLVADTLNALPNSVTLKDGLMRFGMTHILQVGSYTQHEDTILALRASRTNHDLLVVNGPANLGGTLLLLQEGKGKSSSPGRQVTLITTQGLNGSRFDNIQLAHTSLEKLSVNYDTNNVYVIPHFDPIYPYAVSHNARALAWNLDLFSNTGRKQGLFDSLADLSLPQVPAALEKLMPNQVFALSSIGLSVSHSQMRILQGRLDDLNLGYANYGELNTSAPKQYGLSLAGVSTQTNFLMNKDQGLWNFYMRGNGSFGRQSQDTENEMLGYDYGQGGTFIGADHPLDDKVYVGGAVGYTYTDASFHDDRGSLSTNSYFAHLYAAYVQPKGFNLISSLSLGDHEFDLRRRALTDTARSQPQSREVDFQSQASYNIPLKPNLRISPYAGLAYSALWMNGFQEYNSEANLKISNDQTNSLRSTLGVKAQYEKLFTKGIRKASVEMNLAWEHEYFDAQTRGIDAEWVGGGVPSFRVQGGRIAPDTLISGVNLRLAVTNLLSVITGYDIEANRGYISHNFNVGVNLTF